MDETDKHQARGGSPWPASPAAPCIHLLPARMQAPGVVNFSLDAGLEGKGHPPRPQRARLVCHMYTSLQGKPQNVFVSDNLQGGESVLPITYSNNKPLPQAYVYSPDLIRYLMNRGRGGRQNIVVVIRKMVSSCCKSRVNPHPFPS